MSNKGKRIYKIVLTGGPCGGKTTGQIRLNNFFSKLGWKVYSIPEVATILITGGADWITMEQSCKFGFQVNLLQTVMQLEKTYYDLANGSSKDCLIICDRGTMDPKAYIDDTTWNTILEANQWKSMEMRDLRYDHVVHFVTAADGAAEYYTTSNNEARKEDKATAIEIDRKLSEAWVGHPRFDILDNSTDFNKKVLKLISLVCENLNIDVGDRLHIDSTKRRFLIENPQSLADIPLSQMFDYEVFYLKTKNVDTREVIHKRSQGDEHSYTATRWYRRNDRITETKANITEREYEALLQLKAENHHTVYKRRASFLWNNQYFQLDSVTKPTSIGFLETYTTVVGDSLQLPPWLNVIKEVTEDDDYSMFTLSQK